MELADIVSREIWEWVRSSCQTEPRFWAIVTPKLYCREDGRMGRFGLKVFPDADIRTDVEAHRAKVSGQDN